MDSIKVSRVMVVGTGLIGTSIALALRSSGVHVTLSDRDRSALAKARLMGAGVAATPDDPPADVVVVATPPSTVVGVLKELQARDAGTVYTDVASTKARILAEAEQAGCDMATYVPGHPMAGRELSGPAAACADLFVNRPWALCPHPVTLPGAVRVVAHVVAICGGLPKVLPPEIHDRIVAQVSHVPHLVSAALAARFATPDENVLSLAGRGLRDTTRIASGAPTLWRDILEHNADQVATVLEDVVRDLAEAARALRSSGRAGISRVTDLLTRGNRGRRHIAERVA